MVIARAVYPRVDYLDLLPEAVSQPRIVPRLVILHTNAGNGPATMEGLRRYMGHDSVTVECHFDVDSQGRVGQFMPVDVRADCNAAANGFAVSIETEDHGGAGVDTEEWTPAQVEAMAWILAWLNAEWQIELVQCRAWNGYGVGAHRDYAAWSAASHSCPGVARAGQVAGVIARAREIRKFQLSDTGDEEMADVFALDSDPDKLFIQTADKQVRHVTGMEGAVAQAINGAWADGKRLIHVADDVAGWLESMP